MDPETSTISADVSRTLGERIGSRVPQRWIKWGVVAAIVVAIGLYFMLRDDKPKTSYTTQEVTRGDLTVTVTATGNLEPRNQVDIGSELSGTIRAVNVDVNDVVKAGQVLAALDTTRLKAQVLQAQSSLQSAEAQVLQTDASVKEARANFARLQKVRELSGNKLPSQQDMDVAEATVARAEAQAAAAKASVSQSRANLETVQTDLGKTQIRSPIDGVVLVRSVELGQTVAASLQAPILFTMAEDLKKMELHVSVDEADVGSVAVGQEATFTVDAFPNRHFPAVIKQVHFASSNTQKSSSSSSSGSSSSATSTGVVTFETVLEVDNPDLLLRPGMTATAEIVTTSITDAVLVSNAALRFTPSGVTVPGAPNQQAANNPLRMLMPQMRRPGGQRQQGGGGARRLGRAWIIENGKPALVLFRPGATDGRMTQVLTLDRLPGNGNGGGGGNGGPGGPMANNPDFQKALARKLEPGTKVIVDEGEAKK